MIVSFAVYILCTFMLSIFLTSKQVSRPNLDIIDGLVIVKNLSIEIQPNSSESKLPLDLRDSVKILSTVVNVLNNNLQLGTNTSVQNTVVSLPLCYQNGFLYLNSLGHPGCEKQHSE